MIRPLYLAYFGFLVKLFFCQSFATTVPLSVTTACPNVILINGKSGKVLFEKNADALAFPASTTKIATCIYVLERGTPLLDMPIRASHEALRSISPITKSHNNYEKYPSHWIETDSTHVGIKGGETLPLRDLLYALMLASGNDAANMLAEYCGGGSISEGVQELNAFMHGLGMKNTHFCNPSGLHHPKHVTTCRDMAILCKHAMQNPFFREIVKTLHYTSTGERIYVQKNKLLKKGAFYYPFATGIKTGYHSASRYTLAAAAEKDGRLLICVLFNSDTRKERFEDAIRLFVAAFQEKPVQKICIPSGSLPFTKRFFGANTALKTYCRAPLAYSYYPAEEPVFRAELSWNKVFPPIAKGQKVGHVVLYADNKPVHSIPIYAEQAVTYRWYRVLWLNMVKAGTNPFTWAILGAGLALGVFFFFPQRKKTK